MVAIARSPPHSITTADNFGNATDCDYYGFVACEPCSRSRRDLFNRGTALVELRRVVPPNSATVAVKLEWQNPTGSMKDRMAVTAISRAEEDGRLKPGDTVVEYTGIAQEVWQQTNSRVDAFVQMAGTSHSLRGIADGLRRHNPNCRIVAVEPAESAVLSGGASGAHGIEGVGISYVPPLWDPKLVDEIVPVPTAVAKAMARRMAEEEGLFAGTSSGANVCAAIQIVTHLGPGHTVVTLMIDSGLKYLSTDLYRG